MKTYVDIYWLERHPHVDEVSLQTDVYYKEPRAHLHGLWLDSELSEGPNILTGRFRVLFRILSYILLYDNITYMNPIFIYHFYNYSTKDNTGFYLENTKMQPIYSYTHTEIHVLSSMYFVLFAIWRCYNKQQTRLRVDTKDYFRWQVLSMGPEWILKVCGHQHCFTETYFIFSNYRRTQTSM